MCEGVRVYIAGVWRSGLAVSSAQWVVVGLVVYLTKVHCNLKSYHV